MVWLFVPSEVLENENELFSSMIKSLIASGSQNIVDELKTHSSEEGSAVLCLRRGFFTLKLSLRL